MRRSMFGPFLVVMGGLWLATTGNAYVDMAPTIGRVVREAEAIALVEVDRINAEKGIVILKKVHDFKGDLSGNRFKHRLVRANETVIDRPIADWAEPSRRAVLFLSGKTALVCLGQGWYQVSSGSDGWWQIGATRPDLPLAYYGTVSRLSEAIESMLAGKHAVITALPHGGDQESASFDLALNRASLPGLAKVHRFRAHLGMPQVAMGLSMSAESGLLIGPGPAGVEEIPALRKKLQSIDPTTRAESAADLGSLGGKAAVAIDDLAKLLNDPSPMARMSAAAALLRITPSDRRGAEILAKGLASKDISTRRHAARAAGLAGPAASPLVPKLAEMLSDSDPLNRRIALQAIATLGPAAASALDRVLPLLDQPETASDAADTLGRFGPAAQTALTPLSKLLADAAPAKRWAAVRAMSQIGGADAAPAVKFIVRELRTASEADTYNMMLYLSLLGPVAKEAIPAIQSARLMNPFLRQTTIWAINPGPDLPWFGPMGQANVAQWVLESYAHELGDHIKPVAMTIARKIMEGTAGNVPTWGYKMMARFSADTLAILTPGLRDADKAKRERTAVAIGYMGSSAAAARPEVAKALAACRDEREQRLLKWCLREIE